MAKEKNRYSLFNDGESFWKNLLDMLTFGLTDRLPKMKEDYQNGELGNAQPVAEGLLGKYTGANLTPAEREANAFTAEQAELARQHDIYMSENKYQMETKSMMEAGLNPAMVYGGGNLVSTHATGAAGSSVSPSSLGIAPLFDIVSSLARLPKELKNLDAQNNLLRSEANKNNAEATNLAEQERGTKLNNDFLEDTYALRKEALEISNDLSRETKKNIIEERNRIIADTNEKIQNIEESKSRQALNDANTALAYASTAEIILLASYKADYYAASTNAQQSYALLNGLQYTIQHKLLDDGYYDAIVSAATIQAESAGDKQKINHILTKLKTGKAISMDDSTFIGRFINFVADASGINNGVAVMLNLFSLIPQAASNIIGSPALNVAKPNPIGFGM